MKKKCCTPYCRNRTQYNKCSTCSSREWRKQNPMRASYLNLKSNSKRRGKDFTLTYEEFTEFCRETKYIQGKGKSLDSYTIDRIDNDKGYTIDNIQVLTFADNRSKGTKSLSYDWETKWARVYEHKPLTPEEAADLPF